MKDYLERFDAPPTRFCDLVMEGGITSGVIYASAVADLADHYRFRNIGGSSIGAFAAALAAAAEYSRRHGSKVGFEFLDRLPGTLMEVENGQTKLRSMFRPQPTTRRLFNVFVATIGHKKSREGLLQGLLAALLQYWLWVLLAVVVVAAGAWVDWTDPGPVSSWVARISFLLMTMTFAIVLALAAGIALDVWRGLVPNDFGLCRGWSKGETGEDLAGFLYGAIQEAAGRDVRSTPVTFKDLWDAPSGPTTMLNFSARGEAARSVNLEVYATNLSHSRPYRFPLDDADDTGRLFFRLEDMARFFPEPVLLHLAAHARPYQRPPDNTDDPAPSKKTQDFLELPHEHLPIVVAARMAMSFPLLISAVPLWAIDYELPQGKRRLERCWISDGGLCSNFPIHLFDCFLPKWPTFGISLQKRGEHWEKDHPVVLLPDHDMEGRADTWHRIDTKRDERTGATVERHAGDKLAQFLLGLWLATWRWNDMTMMRMPGVRDRVVRILLDKDEGGVNITMGPDKISTLATQYGKAAARKFVDKFAEAAPGWDEHRWVRFNRLLIALRQQVDGFKVSAALDKHAKPIAGQITQSRLKAPLHPPGNGAKPRPSEGPLDALQESELEQLLAALMVLEGTFKQAGDHKPYEAMPRPSLRVRHPT